VIFERNFRRYLQPDQSFELKAIIFSLSRPGGRRVYLQIIKVMIPFNKRTYMGYLLYRVNIKRWRRGHQHLERNVLQTT